MNKTTFGVRAVAAAALVMTGLHLLLLLAPEAVLRWNRDALRLLVLEACGFVAGVICSLAALARLQRQLFDRARSADRSFADTVALTLVVMTAVSGVVLAAGYRWASSWSVVTLTPFAVSLVRLSPRVELIAATPFVVRLHVYSVLPLAALVSLTVVVPRAQLVVNRVADRAAAALANLRILRRQEIWREEEN
jgi:nitrate reductase gamma subunit